MMVVKVILLSFGFGWVIAFLMHPMHLELFTPAWWGAIFGCAVPFSIAVIIWLIRDEKKKKGEGNVGYCKD